jgi:hypothetical protein
MKFIPLTQGKFAKVDDEDYDWLMQWKWCAVQVKPKCGELWYAGRYPNIKMHREIAARDGLPQVDHQDSDGLNNQRYNLRPCTSSQNHQNKRKTPNCSSQYKGVCAYGSKWVAYIYVTVHGVYKRLNLGYFTDEVEAAYKYDRAAIEHFGKFAKLNFLCN